MKKLLLGLGSLAAVATPVVAVISCGSDNKDSTTKGKTPAEIATADIQAVYDSLNDSFTSTVNKVDLGALAKGDVTAVQLGIELPTNETSVTITLSLDDDSTMSSTGQMSVKALIEKAAGVSQTKTIVVNASDSNPVNPVVPTADINGITSKMIVDAIVAKVAINNSTEAKGYVAPTEVSITSGSTTFKIALSNTNVDNTAGTVTLTATISDPAGLTIPAAASTITLTGFKTSLSDADMTQAIQGDLDAISGGTVSAIAKQANKGLVTDAMLIDAVKSSITNDYGIVPTITNKVFKDSDGSATFTITYTSNSESATKSLTITGLFKTTQEIAVEDATSITPKMITDAIKTKTPFGNTDEAKDYSAPQTVDVTSGSTTFTITLTSTTPTAGDFDSVHGQIKFTASITSPSNITLPTNAAAFNLTGFKTSLSDADKATKIQDELDKVASIAHTGSKLANSSAVTDQILIDAVNVSNSYGLTPVISNKTPTTTDGSMSFDITYTVGSETATKNIKITGLFKTDAEIAQAQIDAVTASSGTAPTKTGTAATTYNTATPVSTDVTPPTQTGIAFTFTSATAINAAGESDVTYNVDLSTTVTGTNPGSVTFTVSGFETAADATTRKANNTQIANLATLASKLTSGTVVHALDTATAIANRINSASTLKAELGIDLGTAPTGSTYKTISATGTTTGSITVSVILSTADASTPDSAAKTVIVQHTSDTALAQAKIAAVTTSTVTTPPAKTSTTGATTQNGGTPVTADVTLPVQTDIAFTFASATAINAAGESDVTYNVDLSTTVTGTNPGSVTFTVSGFETATDATTRITAANQALLETEQLRINGLSSGTATLTQADADKITSATLFDAAVATSVGITTPALNADFTYTYIKTTGGITITVKLVADTSLTATTHAPAEIAVTFA